MKRALCLLLLSPLAAEDLLFYHCSDTHVPVAGTAGTVAEMAKFTGGEPAFVVVTGDLTEFGGGDGAWEKYLALWKPFPMPVYSALGNHDETWWVLRPEIAARHGAPWYSWDAEGCHFVVLDSAGPQDPRPTFAPEELAWLREDLARVTDGDPVFIAFHHPLSSGEFASPRDPGRLIEVVKDDNVVAFLVGHGHVARHEVWRGYDMIEGGSTFGKDAGWNVCRVHQGSFSVTYRETDGEERLLIEKRMTPMKREAAPIEPIPEGTRKALWAARVPSAVRAAPLAIGDQVVIVGTNGRIWRFDARSGRPLGEERYPGEVFGTPAVDGKALVIAGTAGLWRGGEPTRDRVYVAPPVLREGRVYVGARDGTFVCADAKTLETLWTFEAGHTIESAAGLQGLNVVFGAWDERVYCLDPTDGGLYWAMKGAGSRVEKAPSYYSPADAPTVFFGDHVYAADRSFRLGIFECVHGKLVATVEDVVAVAADAEEILYLRRPKAGLSRMRWTGQIEWTSEARTGRTPVPPTVAGGRVYVTSDDGLLQSVDTADGRVLWTCVAGDGAYVMAPVTTSGGLVFTAAMDGTVVCVEEDR